MVAAMEKASGTLTVRTEGPTQHRAESYVRGRKQGTCMHGGSIRSRCSVTVSSAPSGMVVAFIGGGSAFRSVHRLAGWDTSRPFRNRSVLYRSVSCSRSIRSLVVNFRAWWGGRLKAKFKGETCAANEKASQPVPMTAAVARADCPRCTARWRAADRTAGSRSA